MRSYYCHPADVLRQLYPSFTLSQLEADELYGNEDIETIRSWIDDVEAKFERRARPAREVRVGKPGHPATYESHAERVRDDSGIRVVLNNTQILQLDSSEGDVLELRTGRDTWEDITDEDAWELNSQDGTLRIYRRFLRRYPFWEDAIRDRVLRVTYRHSALGSSRGQAGETTLDSQVGGTDTDTTLSVGEPQRLPQRGIVFLGGAEYANITEIDYDTGDVTVTRGVRQTPITSHAAGTTVHYCDVDIRATIAGKVAAIVMRNDDIADELPVPTDELPRDNQVSTWEDEFDNLVASRTQVHPG